MALVSITRLRVRSSRYLLPFFVRALQSAYQAKRAEDNLAVSVLRQSHRTFWTRTVWTSEEAMKAFMMAGAHRSVMRSLLEWCDEAALVHWLQDSSQPPAWGEAHRRLQAEGRTSKVNHPTADQQAFRIGPMDLPIRGEIALK
ncbi:MAG TPA: DUF3291 domain-containing protein [Verrucomicrobiae bacterium]|nr:DUF3291 domain-containing protein [Verrucomicrobiae bacterium]